MLLWIGCCIFLLTIAAPTTVSEDTTSNTLTPLVIFIVGALVVVVIAGLAYVIRQDRSQKDAQVLYQGPVASAAMQVPVEPRYIVAPVPKKPTPTFLDQKFDKPFIVPKIRVDPPEAHSQ